MLTMNLSDWRQERECISTTKVTVYGSSIGRFEKNKALHWHFAS